MRTARRVRLLIVDDHPVVRSGLVAWFSAAPDSEIVGEAGNLADALEQARSAVPDVIVLDARLPDSTGPEACRRLSAAAPACRILMLSSYADPATVIGCIRAGAAGYLLKENSPHRLMQAINLAMNGQSVVDPAVTHAVLEVVRAAPAHEDRSLTLTEQEARVMRMVAEGLTNEEIAKALGVQRSTVKTHVSHVLAKLGLTRRSQVAAFLRRQEDLPD